MKKAVHSLIAITLFLGMATTSFGQIVMDGDSTDWEGYPILIEAPDNVDGMFPPEVGAVVTDIVDIKTIANKNPKPAAMPPIKLSSALKSLRTLISAIPNTAQFVVIRGR